jgi:phospholipase C
VVVATPKSTDPRIKHVVVLMLENRSFDHMLGFLPHADPTFDGLRAGGFHNIAADGSLVRATSDGEPGEAAPDHSHAGVLEQIAGFGDVPANGGFVRSYASVAGDAMTGAKVMRCLDSERSCAVLAQLAQEFAVCDAWFSSVPGETWPNRNFAHAATSDGAANIEIGFYYDRTIFEQLARGGATWRIYHDGLAQAWCFRNLWRQRVTWLDQVLRRHPTIANWHLQPAFYEHVRAGDLPEYAFIEPAHTAMPGETRSTNSQHPDNNRLSTADFYAGEALIKSVYHALLDNPVLFERTLLLITYDEHGGFYDHVSPPAATPPGGRVWRSWTRRVGSFVRAVITRLRGGLVQKQPDFGFDRLGVRVPTVLISPWIKPGTVVHTRLEHASIPATLRALFLPGARSLTARDGAANTFHQVVRDHGLAAPRAHPGAAAPPADVADATSASRSLLPEVSATMGRMSPPTPPADQGPRSELDRQLVELGQQVGAELRRENPQSAQAPTPPSDARSAVESVDAISQPATVGDAFADAARAARRSTKR